VFFAFRTSFSVIGSQPLIAVMNLSRDGKFQAPRSHLNNVVKFAVPPSAM